MNWYKKIILAGLPAWDKKDFINKLKKEFGVVFLRQGAGSHQLWGNPEAGTTATIPFDKGSKILNPVTMEKILRELNIPLKAFKKRHFKKKEINQDQLVQQTEKEETKIPDYQNQPWYKKQQEMIAVASKWEDHIPGGRADGKTPSDFNRKSIEKGKRIEFEHTDDPDTAKEITMDHLEEFPDYYDDKKGLPSMEKDLEETKDARGLYNQQQGDERNPFAGDEAIQDWQTSNEEELKMMKAFAQQHRFEDMRDYGEKLVQQGYPRMTVEKIMTAAMFGVKL